MNKEDFDSEVSALFEEDSVLAQAVIELQQRKERIEAEKAKEAEARALEADAPIENSNDPSEEGAVDGEADSTSPDAKECDSPNEASENDTFAESDANENETEQDGSLSPALSKTASDAGSKASSKVKKKKKKSSRKNDTDETPTVEKKQIASTVQLLEFVSGENTVRPDGKAPLFDLGFKIPKHGETNENQDAEEAAEASAHDQADTDADAHASTENDTNSETPDSIQSEAATNADADLRAEPAPTEQPAEDTAYREAESDGSIESSNVFDDAPIGTFYEDIQPPIGEYADAAYFSANEGGEISNFDTIGDGATDKASADTENDASEYSETELHGDEQSTVTDEESERYAVTDTVPATKNKAEEKGRFIDGVFDFLELFIFSLAAVLLLTTFFFRHSVVDGSSMEQTLFHGEHIIISNFLYEPERGDIIVCEDYSLDNEYYRKPLVKRIIGVPGDVVEIKYDKFKKRSDVYVNGELLDEDYVYIDTYPEYRNDSGRWVVGEGEVFVMGDHRNNSSDSRNIGCIRIDSIIGKALIRFYPFEKFGKIE